MLFAIPKSNEALNPRFFWGVCDSKRVGRVSSWVLRNGVTVFFFVLFWWSADLRVLKVTLKVKTTQRV